MRNLTVVLATVGLMLAAAGTVLGDGEPPPDTAGAWIIYPDATPDHWVGNDRYSSSYGSDLSTSIHEALGYSGSYLCPGDPGHDGGDFCHWENYSPAPEGSTIELRGPGLWDIGGHDGECGGPAGCGTGKQKSLVMQDNGITICGQSYDDGTGKMVQQEVLFNNGATTALFYCEASDLGLNNLHIRGTWPTNSGGYGIAVGRYAMIGPDPNASRLTVTDCTFEDLRAPFDQQPTVKDLTVTDNTATDCYYNLFKKGVTFTGACTIAGNTFTNIGLGKTYPCLQILDNTGTTCISGNTFDGWVSGNYAIKVEAYTTAVGIATDNVFVDQLGGIGAAYELYPLSSGGHAVGGPDAGSITVCQGQGEAVPIPEPGALAPICVGMMGLIRRKRRS